MSDAQKALRSEERLAMTRITTVLPTGISNMFNQDRPALIRNPINTPQNTQGMANAIARLALML